MACDMKLRIIKALDGDRLLIGSKVCRVTFEYGLSFKVPSPVNFLCKRFAATEGCV